VDERQIIGKILLTLRSDLVSQSSQAYNVDESLVVGAAGNIL
jgi:hypothetical protein